MKKLTLLFLCFILFSCKTTQQLAKVSESSYRISDDTPMPQDSSIIHLIKPYKESLDQQMNEVIATAAITLKKAQPQSTLGNWMSDAIKIKTEEYLGKPIDFATQNYGGIRIPELRQGPVMRGKMYELMPFENRIVVLELDAKAVQTFLDHTASRGGWPLSKEVQMVIEGDRATGVSISGEALQANKTYLMALPDYIANGGDRTDFLAGHPRTDLPNLIRDALIEYAEDLTKAGKSIDAEMDHRVKINN